MTSKISVFLLLFCSPCLRAAVVVSNISVTATQAVLPFTAPDFSPCQVEVSESPGYVPLVHDVDPSLFTGSNLDSRAGGLSRGTDRIFVIGKRAAEIGLDTIRYSRALQTATQHYYRITCGGQVATGSFSTTTIPFGNGYAEPEASDPKLPGAYAYPTLSMVDRNQTVIDPQTGVQIKRLTMPTDVALYGASPTAFSIGRGAAWANTAKLVAGSGAASVSGSTGKLFLGLDMTQGLLGTIHANAQAYGPVPSALAYYQVHLSAAVNPSGNLPANPADSQYSVCLSLDAFTCYAGSSIFTATASTVYTQSTFGTQNTIDLWQSTPGTKVPDYRDQGPRLGTTSCDGSSTATLTGGEPFNTSWGPGSTLTIGGIDYTIAKVVHTALITLTGNCSPVTNAASFGNNFGVLIWKTTASADTLSINSAYVVEALNSYYGTGVGGGIEYASAKTVVGPNGNPGYNYRSGDNNSGLNYWVDDVTGQGHLRGTVANPTAGCNIFTGQFYVSDPDVRLCGGGAGLYLIHFYFPFDPPAGIQLFGSTAPCNTSPPNAPPYTSQQPCEVAQTLTPGTTLNALVQAFTSNPLYAPQFDPARYTNYSMTGSDSLGNVLLQAQSGGYESLGWSIVFNPAAVSNAEGGSSQGASGNHGCVGGGQPGCVVAAMPVWTRHGCRWCNIKGLAVPYDGWVLGFVGPWTNSGPGTGPYTVPVVDGTANGTGNLFDASASLHACPASPLVTPGGLCTSVTVGSEPVSPSHGGVETGLPGEIGGVLPGDYMTFDYNEIMMLITKTPGAIAGTWVETFQRNINQAQLGSTLANPTLVTYCSANQTPSVARTGASWYWNALADPHGMNADGTTIPPNGASQTDHEFWSNGNEGTTSQNVLEGRCAGGIFACYTTRVRSGFSSFAQEVASGPTAVQTRDSSFSVGSVDVGFMQSHPTGGGITPVSGRANFMFDGRPYYGGYASGSVRNFGDAPAIPVSGQLYKLTAAQMPNLDLPFRKWTPTGAFTGNLPLVDVSSPATGNVIPTDSSGAYTYCVAAAVNECRTGSAIGDVYVNAPYIRYPFCYIAAQNGNLSDEYDICISGSSAARDAVKQISMTEVDNLGTYQRVLTKFLRPRVLSVFFTPYVFPDGKWLTYEANLVGDASVNKPELIVKIPPPATDSINRTGFESIDVTVPGSPGVSGAYIQFGYAENGPSDSFFCTTRAETCIATGTPLNSLIPFHFQQTEAASWSPVPCASGCVISIPAIPQRTLYYQYVYTGVNGQRLYAAPASIVSIP